MRTDDQRDLLNKNYDELEDDQKNNLLVIGEKLLSIQDVINREKVSKLKRGIRGKKSNSPEI